MPKPLAKARSRKLTIATPKAITPVKKKPTYKPSPIIGIMKKTTPTKMPKVVKKTKVYKTVSKTRAYKTASKGYGLAVSTRNKVWEKADKVGWHYRRALKTFLKLQMWGAIMYLSYIEPIQRMRAETKREEAEYEAFKQRVHRAYEEAEARARAHPNGQGNWWTFFGVDRNCPDEAVKSKYRQAAKAAHPDVTKDDGELMRKINNMYDAFKRERGIR